jgi:hypothetical protein
MTPHSTRFGLNLVIPRSSFRHASWSPGSVTGCCQWPPNTSTSSRFAAQGGETELAERVDCIKTHAGPRFEQIELAFSFFQVALDSVPDLTFLRMLSPESSDADLLNSVTLLHGSVTQAADRTTAMREKFGITSFTVNLGPCTPWESLEKLIAAAK